MSSQCEVSEVLCIPWRAPDLDAVDLAQLVLKIGAHTAQTLLELQMALYLLRVVAPVVPLIELRVQ
jgi:hypothetical protein